MPASLCFAIAVTAVYTGQPIVGSLFLVAFCGLLRVGEALALTWDAIYFSDTAVALVLARTKRGIEQKVALENPCVVSWFRTYRDRYQHLSARVFPVSYHKVNYWLRKLTQQFGFHDVKFSSHSLRRGGASELVRLRVPVADICLFGRWASHSSASEYMRRGEVFIMRLKGSHPEARWSQLEHLASIGHRVWDFIDQPSD